MARMLDLVALRSFVAVADSGGVTRAAGLLNLTQSAVSMQLKRLEEALDLGLFARAARKLTLTPEGEQLLVYARKMLALNDEAMARLTSAGYEGELRLGVPHDIVYPAIPGILKRLAALYPRVRVSLASSFTLLLREGFARGEYDVILTTEDLPGAGAEVLGTRDLVWVGADDGQIWQKRPLRLGFKDSCIFRQKAIAALTGAGIAWELAVDGESEQAIEATVAADLAISARLTNAMPQGLVPIEARGALPDLGQQSICLYAAPTLRGEPAAALLSQLRQAYCC
ncbi:LysR family transcriptional regulator [Paragemmobacter straminiformis]|uniref:LysR family transcriptional regulator n=1 Tax=Paragemmobacter straminiformis TaxID=2045119 RepID=A0A842I4R3_9RHOB|nr:LysR family transcriptional regulator [Gemmobacter straminiformis]MBC2834387.1 LysR family transcriptional regulator [Gemmobacter straminiformis]